MSFPELYELDYVICIDQNIGRFKILSRSFRRGRYSGYAHERETMTEAQATKSSARTNRRAIRRVLLVGSPYDAFLMEDAGFRMEGETDPPDAPTLILARSGAAALTALENGQFDMVLADQKLPDMTGSKLVQQSRARYPNIPAVVFSGNTGLGNTPTEKQPDIDVDMFIYYGAPSFWRALVKLQEDQLNADTLLQAEDAMAILLVEDEPNFYSHFLPALYERIRTSAIELLPRERRPKSVWGTSTNRPLVLLRRNFEDACEALMRYEHQLTALITDLCFPVGGQLHNDAGLRLLYRARAIHGRLPIIVASRDREHRKAVIEADAKFLWKDSPRLLSELDNFLTRFCGFGPFVFHWPAGERYGLARSLQDMRDLIADVPDVVFEHHALHHDFVAWMAVHGYQRLARKARKLRITEPNLREKLLEEVDRQLARNAAP